MSVSLSFAVIGRASRLDSTRAIMFTTMFVIMTPIPPIRLIEFNEGTKEIKSKITCIEHSSIESCNRKAK